MASAADVVQAYLQNRRSSRGEYTASDRVIADATRAVVAELPDGFKRRDVITCVKALTADTPELAEVKDYRRTLVAGKTLKAMTADNEIVEADGAYQHVAF